MEYHTKHVTNELIDVILRLHSDFWTNQVFLDTLRLKDELDAAVADLIAIDVSKRLAFRNKYSKLQREQPAYDPLLMMSADEIEGFLRTVSDKKLYQIIVELSYKKNLLEAIPLAKNLRTFLAEINYLRTNYGKGKSQFGFDPNYVCISHGPSRRIHDD